MPAFTVSVKWGREMFKDVDVHTDENPDVFKAQIYALTGVLPERQKIMVKGKTLGETWQGFPIAPKVPVLLMGSKEEDIATPPSEKVKFVEDMNDSELATAMELPVGLANLGNTCYMNATVQCLKTVPPLTQALKQFAGGVGSEDSAVSITAALRDLYTAMDKGIAFPAFLLGSLHKAIPRFAERGQDNVFQQQDANEFWTELMRMMQQKLPAEERGKYSSVIDECFGGSFTVEMKCDETEIESPSITTEKFLQLSCFIAEETKYMHSGLVSKMTEKITKNSPTLGKDALYTKTSQIDRLPAYLAVQMVRFYYKERSATNAKMLRDVKFPLSFDAYDLCTKRLQERLLPMREKFKEFDDQEAAGKLQLKDKKEKTAVEKEENFAPCSFVDDRGSNNSGFYELQAVLTHKGRTSNSGHYVAWIRHKDDTWIMCDDDKVHIVTSEDVLKLSGGGDWHTAYVLLYGPRLLKLSEGQIVEPIRSEIPEGENVSME